MRVTIIPSDKTVYVDSNVAIFNFVVDSQIPTIHAIQWYDTEGTIEHIDEQNRMIAVEKIHSINFVQDIVNTAIEIINTPSPMPTINDNSRPKDNSSPTII